MCKILRVDAFSEVTKAIDENDWVRANAIMDIVINSIVFDKKNNTFSEYIELKTKKEQSLFQNADVIE